MYTPTTFPGQQPDEKIVVVLHRHWFVFIKNFARILLMAIFPLVVAGIVTTFTSIDFSVGSFAYTLLVMGSSLYLFFLLLLLYDRWLDYALDVFIVSDKRVVDIEQSGLFHRTVSEQRLYRVQDVTFEVKGVIRTFLQFGDVYIQTAAERERFVFEDVPHPDRITEVILRLIDKDVKDVGAGDQPSVKTVLENTTPVSHHQHPPAKPQVQA